MDKETILAIFQVLGPAILGCMAFLARDYFKSLQREIHGISKDMAKLEGRMTYLLTETTKVSTELRAIWRFVDKPKSDLINGDNA